MSLDKKKQKNKQTNKKISDLIPKTLSGGGQIRKPVARRDRALDRGVRER